MSRIFDALQKSGFEQSGIEYPDMVSVATEVFEAEPKKQAPRVPEGPVPVVPAVTIPEEPIPEAPFQFTDELLPVESTEVAALEFPSVTISPSPTSRLVFLTEPDSLAAEKFRFLSVKLRQIQQSRPLKRILITSTIAEEGKSLVSANLAGALARRKHKVLLLEGDLRRPTLADRLGLGRLAGVGEWLHGDGRKLTNIYRLEGADFWFMPAGDPLTNPLEVMQSGKVSELIGRLTNLFDWILVDSPPLLPLADTTVWSRMTDGTLLVTREGTTEKAHLQRGLEILKKSDLLGVVLNSCSQPNHNYYQRYSLGAK